MDRQAKREYPSPYRKCNLSHLYIAQPNAFLLCSNKGQERFHNAGKIIDLPTEAQEIKSAWRALTDEEAKSGRYHMNVSEDGTPYGLIALHIITKDLPQWFWTTFEHVDNSDLDIRDPEDDIRWLDPYTKGGKAEHLPKAIIGTKWENYRLKGTQIDFVTLDGRPTILANAIIERGFMGSSSCVSCHAHATIGASQQDGVDNRLPIFRDIRRQRLYPEDPKSPTARFIIGWTGIPDADLFYDRDYASQLSPRKKYTQTDFMWSFFRAQSEKHPECTR